jgi:isopentenyl-diphosphate delta-isomerase
MTAYPSIARVEPEPRPEYVILLDDDGRAIGTAEKRSVHRLDTPLHLAFSCYVFDSDGRLLVSQRALAKATFPGVWTNSACGHPAPGEAFLDAVRRRTGQELGITLRGLRLVLPRFRYRAAASDGVVENEICPVTTALTVDDPAPDRSEVEGTTWVGWAEFRDGVLDRSRPVSPWCLQQVEQLAGLGDDPLAWPAVSPAELPPAARFPPAAGSDA